MTDAKALSTEPANAMTEPKEHNPEPPKEWFYALDADAEQWTHGGATRDEAIVSAMSDLGEPVFYITTGHKSRYGHDDDHDPEDFEYTMDSIKPEQITTPPDQSREIAELRDALAGCVGALQRLLSNVSNIEVLGEWSALEINRTSERNLRAKVDLVVAEGNAALTRATPFVKGGSHE